MPLVSTLKWLFFPNTYDVKHQSFSHPLISLILSLSSTAALFAWICYKLHQKYTIPSNFSKKIRKYLGPSIILYLIAFIVTRTIQAGTHSMYQGMWICNLSLLTFGIGLIMGNSTLIGASIAAVSLDQVLWYVDVLSFFLRGKWAIGVASYMSWPETSIIKKITTLHHLWFLPLALYTLKVGQLIIDYLFSQNSGWTWKSFLMSVPLCTAISLWARFLVPEWITFAANSSRAPIYLNVNQSWSMWRDAAKHFKILNFIKSCKYSSKSHHHHPYNLASPFYITIPVLISIWSLFNLLPFVVLKQILFRKPIAAIKEKDE